MTIAGVPAPILSLANVNGQEQINIQTPFGLPQGVVSVVVENNGTQATIDGIPVFGAQPGIFEFNFGGQRLGGGPACRFLRRNDVKPCSPWRSAVAVRHGPGSDIARGGHQSEPARSTRSRPLISVPTVALDGVGQEVLGSFYAPQLVTVYQINFRVGASTQPGLLRITVEADGSHLARRRSCQSEQRSKTLG